MIVDSINRLEKFLKIINEKDEELKKNNDYMQQILKWYGENDIECGDWKFDFKRDAEYDSINNVIYYRRFNEDNQPYSITIVCTHNFSADLFKLKKLKHVEFCESGICLDFKLKNTYNLFRYKTIFENFKDDFKELKIEMFKDSCIEISINDAIIKTNESELVYKYNINTRDIYIIENGILYLFTGFKQTKYTLNKKKCSIYCTSLYAFNYLFDKVFTFKEREELKKYLVNQKRKQIIKKLL